MYNGMSSWHCIATVDQCYLQAAAALRPGGSLMFRDYGMFDLTMRRSVNKLQGHQYARGVSTADTSFVMLRCLCKHDACKLTQPTFPIFVVIALLYCEIVVQASSTASEVS
jgi:hypothetical protein